MCFKDQVNEKLTWVKKKVKSYNFAQWLVIIGVLSLLLPDYNYTYYMLSVLSSLVLLRKQSRQRVFSHPVIKYIALLFPIFTFPALVSQNWLGLMEGWIFWYGLIFVCHIFSVMTTKFYNDIIDLMLCMSIFNAVIAFIQAFLFHSSRAASTFGHPNYYASAIEVFIFTAFYRYSKTKKKMYLWCILINVFALILTNCRSAWLALAAAIMFYVVYYVRKVTAVLKTAAALAVVFAIIFIFMPRIDSGDLSTSSDVRAAIWLTAWQWIGKNPLIGYGLAFFMTIYPGTNLGLTPHAHNIIFNTILDYGVIGFIGFCVLFGKYYKVLIRNSSYNADYDRIAKLIISLSVCFLAHGVTDAILTVAHMYILTFIILSGAFVEKNERYNKKLPSIPAKKSIINL